MTLERRDVANLALLRAVCQGLHGGVEGDGGVGDVELVDVDAVELEAAEAAVDGFFEMFGAGVVGPLAGPTRSHPPLVAMTRPLG